MAWNLGLLGAAGSGVVPEPDFLSSAPAWFDATDSGTITESSGSVSQWNNKGTLGDLVQATGSLQPTTGTVTLGGLNTIDFNSNLMATNDAASNWSFMSDGTQYFTAFAIKVRASPAAEFATVILTRDYGSSNGLNMASTSDQDFFYFVGGNTTPIRVNDALFFEIGDAIYSTLADPDNGTAADRLTYFRNNTQGTVTNTNTDAVPGANSDPLTVGGRPGGSLFGNFALGELIVVSGTDATEAKRQEVVDYLNGKWSLF